MHKEKVAPKLPHDIGLPVKESDIIAVIHCTRRTRESALRQDQNASGLRQGVHT